MNTVTPQHPLKHLTDEELKQQYGIHLATRIQGDGDGKEAKWADIDDDEDDWAPEAIEWNDGTKINLPQKDSAALLAEQQAAEEAIKKREEEEKKAKAAKAAAEKKQTTTVGPNATVLKPRSLQTKPGSPLVMKASTEKPTLVSKPTSATPAKSPWAPLPAIDRMPPVEINPPVQVPGSRLQPNGLGQPSAAEPSLQPALEIAADSFKRGGPEMQKDTIGQLYNDKSGKYEPAAAGRRGSMRKDGNFRAPALLQRGGNGPDPAALIESHRLSHDGAGYDAQRRPSTISAEGGDHGRRQSISNALANRRESQHSQATQSPSSTVAQLATTDISSQDARAPGAYRAGPGQSPHPTSDREDVVLQKQLMKEKREQAIKRRQEQEAREEAEKQERIRKKLESLPPVADKKEALAAAVTIEKRPTEALAAGTEKIGDPTRQAEAVPSGLKSPPISPSKYPKSPPKPPVVSASGEPMQYGMMRLHAPVQKDSKQQVSDLPTTEPARPPGLIQKLSGYPSDARTNVIDPADTRQHFEDNRRTEIDHKARIERENALRSRHNQKVSNSELDMTAGADVTQASPFVNGALTPGKTDHLFSRSPELTGQRPAGDVKQQPWNEGSRDARGFPSWNSQQTARDAGSVWGAPSQARPFAGAFDRTIQRPHSGQQDQYQASPALAPIGPPKANAQTKDVRGLPAQGTSPAPGFENSQTVPSYPSNGHLPADARSGPSALLNGGHKLPSPQLPSDGHFGRQAPQQRGKGPEAIAAWHDFSATVGSREAEEARLALIEHQARRAEEARTGVSTQALPQFKEKWKQVETTEGTFDRKRVGVVESLQQFNPAAPPPQQPEIRGPSFVSAADLPNNLPPGVQGRTSRFFPVGGTGRIPTYGHAYPYQLPFQRRGSSPPPPDSNSHPAYHMLKADIVVRLPFDDRPPKPKVKLPPAALTPVQSPQPPPAQLSLRPTSKPLVNLESWQERFNNMLGKKLASDQSPEKRVAQISSATKEPLSNSTSEEDVQSVAAVTLPPQGSHRTHEIDPSSREFNDEEALFEPAPGSMPQVHFPQSFGVSRPWIDKGLTRPTAKELPPSRNIDPSSKIELGLPIIFNEREMLLVFINLLGMASAKSVPVRPPAGLAPTPRPTHQSPTHPAAGADRYNQKPRQQQHGRPYKPREASESYTQSPKTGPATGQRGGAGGSRGGFHRSSYAHRGGHVKQSAVAT